MKTIPALRRGGGEADGAVQMTSAAADARYRALSRTTPALRATSP